MLWILWAHVIALPIFSLALGWSVLVSFGSVLPVALAAIAGMVPTAGMRARSVAVALGLLTACAVLVHAWHGTIEAHGGNPWGWALVHGAFVLAAAAAGIATWRLNEGMCARMTAAHRRPRDTDERFRRVFAGGVTGMALVDRDGRFLSVNQALCTILGYDERALLSRTFESLIDPGTRAAPRII